jgi:hypothetical protein
MQDYTTLNNLNDGIILNLGDVDNELLEFFNNCIKDQYVNLNNIGVNYFDLWEQDENYQDLDFTPYKLFIYSEMLEYINTNYLSIDNYENIIISPQQRLLIGDYIYDFISMDMINVIITNYMETCKCTDIEQIDNHFRRYLYGRQEKWKSYVIKIINKIIKQLENLKRLDIKIKNDPNYQNLLHKYIFYSELINFGDNTNLIEGIFRPIIIRYKDDILWKLL